MTPEEEMVHEYKEEMKSIKKLLGVVVWMLFLILVTILLMNIN